jgi:hypothetical protein
MLAPLLRFRFGRGDHELFRIRSSLPSERGGAAAGWTAGTATPGVVRLPAPAGRQRQPAGEVAAVAAVG